MERYDFEALRQACHGRWEDIIRTLSAVDITQALVTRKHVRCHRDHGRTNQQFRLFDDFDVTGGGICNTCGAYPDGFSLLQFLNGWDRKTAVREVARCLDGRGIWAPRQQAQPPATPVRCFDVDEGKLSALHRVWSAAGELSGTLGEQYFRNRGIDGELPSTGDVRFHPGLRYWDDDNEQSLGYFPAIVSLLRSADAGHPLSVHRTYLDPRGAKADVPKPKKLMPCAIQGAISELGAAIRLYSLTGYELGVTEGMETATAIRMAYPQLPVWACYSASVMTNFRPPEGVKTVHVFGDLDASGTGQVAATRLALRLEAEGFDTRLCLPARRVALPRSDCRWYTKQATPEVVRSRLERDGYRVADRCADLDWLEVWNTSQKKVLSATSTTP